MVLYGGMYKEVEGFNAPTAFLYDSEDTLDNEILNLVKGAEDIMVANVKDIPRVYDYGVFFLVCPKTLCDDLTDHHGKEYYNTLWV